MNLKVLQAAAVLAAGALAGQTADRRGFRSNSDLVLVAATVLDRTDHPVRGLTRADFRLFDDKVEQTIASFGEQDAPLSLAMVFDTSGSMLDKLPIMRGSLAALLADSNPEDEFSLVRFADRAQTAVRWTPNADEIPSAVFSRPAHGRTAWRRVSWSSCITRWPRDCRPPPVSWRNWSRPSETNPLRTWRTTSPISARPGWISVCFT